MTVEAPWESMTSRVVFVHHHIFKNAGATIDSILGRAFGPGYLDHETAIAAGLTSTAALLDFLAARPEIRSISPHHLPSEVMSLPGRDCFDIVLVRHPIDRLRSAYDFLRVDPVAQDEVGALARRLDFRGFCDALPERFPNYVNSPQVTTIANAGGYVRPPDEDAARRAIAIVRRAVITGSVERFDDALIAAEHALQPVCGRLDLAYIAQNVTATRQRSLDDRLRPSAANAAMGCTASWNW